MTIGAQLGEYFVANTHSEKFENSMGFEPPN